MRRAESVRPRRDADAAEVEPVGVPAGDDRGIAHRVAVAVQAHRLAEVIEFGRRQFRNLSVAAKPHREVGGAMAVTWIMAVVVALV